MEHSGEQEAGTPFPNQSARMKLVDTVTERAPGKTHWTRVSMGSANSDGSINVRLDAIPINGTLQLRDWERRESQRKIKREENRSDKVKNQIPPYYVPYLLSNNFAIIFTLLLLPYFFHLTESTMKN
ncbi:hypothetical protein [Pajaroellobacter abortibovis]|uniref:Uncharacterized protein n=1 Tax=Pajaroellobacter abortibovis TaxID=1882918 RepID=A0A1L6MYJ9_9BACT|nr:hypothetical protein [Pajaroellobacter abortibovis]APS00488.1 hypothetical protein BCY86_07215 [Pajaroellobacter abortibovis]